MVLGWSIFLDMKITTTRINADTFRVNGDDREVIVAKNDGMWSLTIDGTLVSEFFAKRDALHYYRMVEAH